MTIPRIASAIRAVALAAMLLALLTSSFGCMSAYRESMGGDTERVFTRVYFTDFETAWQSVLDALKHNRLDVVNHDGGFVETRWTDNTTERNFVDSFGGADAVLKAQYRVKVNVSKSFFNNRPAVKVVVQREQLIKRDVLEGWQPVSTDGVEERTLLYRIGRLILIKTKIARIEEERTQKALENTNF